MEKHPHSIKSPSRSRAFRAKTPLARIKLWWFRLFLCSLCPVPMENFCCFYFWYLPLLIIGPKNVQVSGTKLSAVFQGVLISLLFWLFISHILKYTVYWNLKKSCKPFLDLPLDLDQHQNWMDSSLSPNTLLAETKIPQLSKQWLFTPLRYKFCAITELIKYLFQNTWLIFPFTIDQVKYILQNVS